MPGPRSIVLDAIRAIVSRRSDADLHVEIESESDLFDDLELDSLEVLELSGILEETYGSDPFTQDQAPRTVADVIRFYER
jgi:acyl carrier protein